MILENEFRVALPVDRAWAVLTDLPGIAPCLPGAALTAVDGDVHRGTVRVKVGPMVAEYAGTAKFESVDPATHEAVIAASGSERRGGGTASATIRASLRADGDGTVVQVHTDLRIAGKIAQFGSGAIQQVSAALLDEFAANLETTIAGGATPEADTETEPAAAAPVSLFALLRRTIARWLHRRGRRTQV